MSNWSCRRCDGDGMYYDEQRHRYVICNCPSGEAKRCWLKMWAEMKIDECPEERRREKKYARKKKKRDDEEPLPDWVTER